MHRVCGLRCQDNSCKACFMHGCPHAWRTPRVGSSALLHSLPLQSPSAAVRWSALMQLKVTKEWGARCGILSVLLPAAFLTSLWGSLKWQLLCETFDFSAPLSSAPAFPLPLYPSLLLGMKEPRSFLLSSRLPDRERDSHSASKQWPAESLPHFRHYQRANKAVSQRAGQAAFEVRCWESRIGGKKMTTRARRTRVKKESRTRKIKCIMFASTRMSRYCLSSRDSPQLDAVCLFCLAFLASIFSMFFFFFFEDDLETHSDE